MAAWKRGRAIAFVAMSTAIAACNVLSGGHDRFLDDSDASRAVKPFPESGADVADDEPLGNVDSGTPDGDAAAITFIDVSRAMTSLNGAGYTTSPAGTEITTFGGTAYHAIIVPAPQPAIPSEDFTVYATMKVPNDGEWGILTRVQPGGTGAYALGSKFGTVDHLPFLGSIAPPDWNPSLDSKAGAADGWVFAANARYNFMLKVVGNFVSGKMWDASLTEPRDFQVTHLAPWSTGRAIGYYNYIPTGGNGAVLESMRVSVP